MKTETATFGGGCFWCTEAIFQRLKGVETVSAGYAGGKRKNPSYEQVSSGATGHAETIQITFDPSKISYDKLLQIFFATHDPTTMNRQGGDVGTQYRSVIFYHNAEQENATKKKIAEISANYSSKIVTEVLPLENFYKAEDYHQDYYTQNRTVNPYCSAVIDPKVKKLLERFNNDVKEEYKESF